MQNVICLTVVMTHHTAQLERTATSKHLNEFSAHDTLQSAGSVVLAVVMLMVKSSGTSGHVNL